MGRASAIFADCVDLVTAIGNVKFQHCFRAANEVDHELARICSSDENSCNWVDEPPSFLLSTIVNDNTV